MVKVYIHEVSGIQFLGGHTEKEKAEIKEFLGDIRHYYDELDLIIPDDEGDLVVNETDYILKEANGKVYAIEESDFKKLYRENEPCECEPANDDWKRNRSFSTALNWLKRGENESMECLGFIRMKTADNKILSGWLASQTDMLSEDWEIYEEE